VSGWSLGRVAGDFFAYVQLFQQADPSQRADASSLRQQLIGLLEGFSKNPISRSASAVDVEEARFALVAWADEMILRSEWPGNSEWLQDPLQLQLFHTNRGGDEFFERLARLRAEQTDVREVFFLCLVFGFEGQYADRDPERRNLIAQQFELLRVAKRALDVSSLSPVTPAAYDVEIQLPTPRGSSWARPLVALAGLAAVVFGVLFLTLFFVAGTVPSPGS
jgi:type VI secretion system protein ImpK